ncbi:MAG: hypothetical protein JW809_00355 [Pirellulales bacterium]|nr:hypothetical protein [Pirellulales bacterium]
MATIAAILTLGILTAGPSAPLDARYPGAKPVFECDFGQAWDVNFDGWPDHWTRRQGPGFPHYVEILMSDEPSPVGNRCLRIELDGGGAVAYSPPIDVTALYAYVLEGQMKTEGLKHDRAFFSLTFLDEKNKALARFTTPAVCTVERWTKYRLGPVEPPEEGVRTAVIGLHLEPRTRGDLTGAAVFNDIWLGRLPRMNLSTALAHNIFTKPGEVEIQCRASGFPQQRPLVSFQLEGVHGDVLARSERPLAVRRVAGGAEWSLDRFTDDPSGQSGQVTWKPPLKEPGFYRVRAELLGSKDGSTCVRVIHFAIIEPWPSPLGGEFGWSLPRGAGPLSLPTLGRLLGHVGIHWVKYPLWYGKETTEAEIEDLIQFSERLATEGIEMIGVLDQPPPEIRARFGRSRLLEAADIFTANPEAWYPSIEPVLTRLSTRVQWWQLGRDADTSFVGCLKLGEKLAQIKATLDRVGEDVNLGVAWNWIDAMPPTDANQTSLRFLALSSQPPLTHEELSTYLIASRPNDPPDGTLGQERMRRWVVLEPLDDRSYSVDVRATDLVRRMMAAKIDGADAVFSSDPFHAHRGLLNDDGTPSEMLLVWRTAAMLLGGSRHLGSIVMPNGSSNEIFARHDDAVMVVWNDRPCKETLYLGDNVRQVDVWGRTTAPATDGRQQVVPVGKAPSFVTGLNKAVAQWRMDFALEKSRIPSIFGRQHQNAIEIRNHFPRGAGGQVDLVVPDIWNVTPRRISFRLAAGESVRVPFEILLPYDANNGVHEFRADFEVQADQLYHFSVYRQIEVGLGGVWIESATSLNHLGQLEVVQNFVNATDERVSFRCQLSAPGYPRQETRVLDLPRGNRVRIYHLPNGEQLLGKTLWIRAQEIGGVRKLNYRFTAER